MTISNILEHWASIYKPLSHNPGSERLEDQSFFRIRYIDKENVFSRNANIVHSPCMLYSILATGELINAKEAVISHQVWFLAKVKDTPQTLGRYDGNKMERTAQDLAECCKDLIAWLIEVKRTGTCPVTGRSFADDAVVMAELRSIDTSSISFGLVGDIFSGQWFVMGLDWKSLQPLYKFHCGMQGKYIVPKDNTKG
jgi:hypothetical protein